MTSHRSAMLAILLFLLPGAAPGSEYLYGYYGAPLDMTLDGGRALRFEVFGRAQNLRDDVELHIDGEPWKRFRITMDEPRQFMSGNVHGHDVSAECEAEDVRMGREMVTITPCRIRIDGDSAGVVRPDRLLLPRSD